MHTASGYITLAPYKCGLLKCLGKIENNTYFLARHGTNWDAETAVISFPQKPALR